MTANVAGPTRLPGLDGLRALAVSGVILDHLALSTGALGPWALRGRFGVTVFFVLSGFLITHLLLREEDRAGKVSLPRFYLRRALRILPPAVAYLAVIAALMLAGLVAAHWRDLATSLLFLRNVFPGQDDATIHYWSLSVEEQFYLLWPPLFVILRGRARLVTLALLAATVAAKIYRISTLTHPFGLDDQISTLFNADALLIGCALALLRHTARGAALLSSAAFASLAPFFVGLALIAFALATTSYASPASLVLTGDLALLGVALVINVLIQNRASIFNTLLDLPPIAWLGRLSYSLYLWQQLFCKAAPTWWAGHPPQGLLFALAAAAASYYLLELPALRLRDTLMAASSPPAGRGS